MIALFEIYLIGVVFAFILDTIDYIEFAKDMSIGPLTTIDIINYLLDNPDEIFRIFLVSLGSWFVVVDLIISVLID